MIRLRRALEAAACQWHAFSSGSQHPVDVGFERTGVERRRNEM